jgi:anaerobic magnesium-protoporphyrin IX monomethyl ester cyclase
MKKVLLLDPPGHSHEKIAQLRRSRPLPSMALGYIAENLATEGVPYDVVDLVYEDVTRQLVEGYDIIALPAFTYNFNRVKQICAQIRDLAGKDCQLILGGPHPTALPEMTLEESPWIDGVVAGEGEQAMVELASGGELGQVMGTYGRQSSGVVAAPARHLYRDLDSLPWPRYRHSYLPLYSSFHLRNVHGLGRKRVRQMLVTGSRGCPGRCTYCYGFLGERGVRYRDLDSLFEEIEYHQQVNGANYIAFGDPTLICNKSRFYKIVEFLNTKPGLYWEAMGRLHEMSDGVIDALTGSGCVLFAPGIESCDDDVLSAMQKDTTYEEMKHWVLSGREKGIRISAQVILGHPGETEESMQRTFARAVELGFGSVLPNFVVPYPGTRLWDMVENGEQGASWAPGMRYNWDAYTRRSIMIQLPGVDNELFYRTHAQFERQTIALRSDMGPRTWLWRAYKASPFLQRARIAVDNLRTRLLLLWSRSRRRAQS